MLNFELDCTPESEQNQHRRHLLSFHGNPKSQQALLRCILARPYWSGQVQISLVGFGIKLFVATEAKSQISFHQISRATGERVKYQKVTQSQAEQQESTGEDTPATARVGKDDIVKGYEYTKGKYVLIEPEEITHLRVPSKHTIEVAQFVDLKDIDPEYLEKPYFVVPENEAQTEAFATVREALHKTGKAALGKIAFSGREHIIALTADADESLRGMMAYTMRYQEELRDPKEYFSDIKKVDVQSDSLELALELIKRRSAKFDPSKFVDGYEVALKELVDAKVNNAPIPQDEPAAPARGKVVNLMDALRRSIATGSSAAPAEKPAETKAPPAKPAARGKAAAADTQGIALVKGAEKLPSRSARGSAKKRSA